MKVEKIYHLADLHIRNLKRHNEYRDVFNKFLENVRKDTDEIVNEVDELYKDQEAIAVIERTVRSKKKK
jgi:hypothetical protein